MVIREKSAVQGESAKARGLKTKLFIQFWQDATSALLSPVQSRSMICGLAKLHRVPFLPQDHKEIPPLPSPLELDYAALPSCMHSSAQDPLVSAL